MRLFVALWPPHDAVGELAAEVGRVRPLAAGLRWTADRQWHLTLAFLGEVADDRQPQLQRRLARACTRHPPLALQFVGGGRFGDRVLFTRVDGSREPLRRLASSTAAAARRSGLPVEERPFRPHLTLARSSAGSDLRPLVAALGAFRGVEWTATDLHLVHSRLGVGSGRPPDYQTVAAWRLTGAAT